jgi:oligoribonuclease
VAGPDVLVWFGVIARDDRLHEIAAVLTDGQLADLAVGPSLILHGPEDYPDAEQQLVAFIDAHVSPKVQPVLAGSTVQRDRRILRRVLPAIDRRVHYRMVDVWTIGELARRWYPDVVAARAPVTPGRAAGGVQAIRESIDELRFYRQHLFSAPA